MVVPRIATNIEINSLLSKCNSIRDEIYRLESVALLTGVDYNQLINSIDDTEKIEYLSLKAKDMIDHRPRLIFLDINLPKVDGKEVLHYIKTDDVLKTIPVVMLTSSSLQKDIYYAYNNQANCYIVKPSNLKEFNDVIHNIESFWLDCVTYPNLN